jgi:hypothetical protein
MRKFGARWGKSWNASPAGGISEVMVWRQLILGIAGTAGLLSADARYLLVFEVKASPLIQMASAAAGVEKLESAGEEVFLKGPRVVIAGKKSSLSIDAARDVIYIIDHTDKTFEKHTHASFKRRLNEDLPPLAASTLRRFFPLEGKPLTPHEVTVEKSAAAGSLRSLEAFHNTHGLEYLIPGASAVLALTPSLELQVKQLAYEGVPTRMRFQVGAEGKFVNAFVEIQKYAEGPVDDAVFLPPAGYTEAATAPNAVK